MKKKTGGFSAITNKTPLKTVKNRKIKTKSSFWTYRRRPDDEFEHCAVGMFPIIHTNRILFDKSILACVEFRFEVQLCQTANSTDPGAKHACAKILIGAIWKTSENLWLGMFWVFHSFHRCADVCCLNFAVMSVDNQKLYVSCRFHVFIHSNLLCSVSLVRLCWIFACCWLVFFETSQSLCLQLCPSLKKWFWDVSMFSLLIVIEIINDLRVFWSWFDFASFQIFSLLLTLLLAVLSSLRLQWRLPLFVPCCHWVCFRLGCRSVKFFVEICVGNRWLFAAVCCPVVHFHQVRMSRFCSSILADILLLLHVYNE